MNYQQLSKVFHTPLTATSESNLAAKMQVDEVIWQVINHQFCSFKTKIARERTFCQNPYNVSGLCIRRYDRVCMMLWRLMHFPTHQQFNFAFFAFQRLSFGKQSICDYQRGGRCLLFVHKNSRESTYTKIFMGEDQITRKLLEGTWTCLWSTGALPKISCS